MKIDNHTKHKLNDIWKKKHKIQKHFESQPFEHGVKSCVHLPHPCAQKNISNYIIATSFNLSQIIHNMSYLFIGKNP